MTNVDRFRKIAEELGDLYEKKNKCYGGSFSSTYEKLGLISAVTRISDKYNRLCNLATNPDIDNLGESLEDTLRDMASYCIMTVMELENSRKVSAEFSIVIPDDAPILAMVREENKKIRKGDMFECIKHLGIGKYLGVGCDDECAYTRGEKYLSEDNGCITDNFGNHISFENLDWWYCFKRI